MKKTLLALGVLCVSVASACGCSLQVNNVWVRTSNAVNSAAYMELNNPSDEEISLKSASSDICDHVEIHDHIKEGSVFKMRPIPEIKIPAGQSVELKSGGKHIMLMGLKAPLKEGDKVKLDLNFSNGKVISLEVPVQPSPQKHKCQCNHHH